MEEKVTPKFKVGDVVVGSDGYVREILGIGNTAYFYRVLITNDEFTKLISLVDGDWSLKPKEVTITRDKFAEVWDKITDGYVVNIKKSDESYTFKEFCKELGL